MVKRAWRNSFSYEIWSGGECIAQQTMPNREGAILEAAAQASTYLADDINFEIKFKSPNPAPWSLPDYASSAKRYSAHREIINAIAEKRGVSPHAILGKSRAPNIVDARHEAIGAVYLSAPDLSLTAVGKVFGRDHSTILYALRQTGVQVRSSPERANA